MTANVGMADRIIRFAVGCALLAYFFLGSGPASWLGLIGIVAIVTALAGRCPVYRILGLSTCGR